MSFLARRRAEKMFRDGGWGPLLSFPVALAGRPPLVFQMRLPLTTQLIDLERMVQDAPEAPALVRYGQAAIAQAAGPAGTILVATLSGKRDDGGVDVLGTLTVALGASGGESASDAWRLPDSGETDDPQARVRTTITRLSDAVAQIRQLMVVELPGRDEPTPVVVLQYLIRSRYGPLSMTFATAHPGMLSEEGRAFFAKIFETGYIGETPQPY